MYSAKILGILLILCTFSRMITVNSLLVFMFSFSYKLLPKAGDTNEFHLVDQALTATKKFLVTLMTLMSLL